MINDAGKQAVKAGPQRVTGGARPMKALAEQINEIDGVEVYGRVVGVRGLMVEVAGPIHAMSVGARVVVETPAKPIPCEVVGFAGGNALLMPFAPLEGVRRGCRATVSATPGAVRPSAGWLGRVVNALGEPLDGKGPLPGGASPYPFRNTPPAAHARQRVGAPLDLGRAGDQHLHDLLPRPAHGHFLRLRRRQIGAALHAGAQCRGRRLGDRPDRRARPRGAGIPAGRSGRGGPGPLGGGGFDLRRAGPDAPPGGLPVARRFGILPRRGQGRAAADGFGHALRGGAARNRALDRRAADRQRLYADGVFRTAAAAGAGRAGGGRGHHHRHFQRAGRRRRPQRADCRCGARHPRRPYRDGARDRGARPLSGDQRAQVGVANHAAGRRPGLSGCAGPRPAGDGDLCRHGGIDPAWRLSAGIQPRGRRGDPAAPRSGGLPGPR